MMHAILVRARVPETSVSASHGSKVDLMLEHLLICTKLMICLLEQRLICLVPEKSATLQLTFLSSAIGISWKGTLSLEASGKDSGSDHRSAGTIARCTKARSRRLSVRDYHRL